MVESCLFDAELLRLSRLYRQSRELYLAQGGVFRATLTSSARTLSSPILLENCIEYTPLGEELQWLLTDPIERKKPKAVKQIRQYISSVYHEQNHRILWKLLPLAPSSRDELRRYLHLAESLVIVADMALGDELRPKRAAHFKNFGVIYDPGTDVRQTTRSKRLYRNYLQACLHATYLNLELFDRPLIARVVEALYANAEPLTQRAIQRASRLNRKFITQTNLVWQHKHRRHVIESLAKPNSNWGPKPIEPLKLDDDPRINFQQYSIAERWFDLLGI